MKSVVSEKGQTTIPKRIRDKYGIGPHEVIEWIDEDGRVYFRKTTVKDRISAVYGILGTGRSTDEVMRELRGDHRP
jgi:AbrB family looped-hinge helix DNA binding protein